MGFNKNFMLRFKSTEVGLSPNIIVVSLLGSTYNLDLRRFRFCDDLKDL
jgi:hypothetical protein